MKPRSQCPQGHDNATPGTRHKNGQCKECKSEWRQQHPLYDTWQQMKQRCSNPQRKDYKHYGGRGITVCERWQDFPTFEADILSEIGPRPKGKSFDRTENGGHYEPGNVQWSTRSEQNNNRRPPKVSGEIPYKGVRRSGKKFQAQIRAKGKMLYLGTFNTPEEASEIYEFAKKQASLYEAMMEAE